MEDTLCNMCDNIIISVIKETSFVVNVQFLEFLYEKQYVFVFLGIKSTNVAQKNLHCVILIFFNSFSPYCCEINLANRKNNFPEQPSTHDGKLFTVSPSVKCSGSWEWNFHLAVIETDKSQKTMSTQP